jgi:putative methyltransferase (TIGR04325 family)
VGLDFDGQYATRADSRRANLTNACVFVKRILKTLASSEAFKSFAKAGEGIPLLRPLWRLGYDAYFTRATGLRRLFRGVYGSFQEAVEAAPKTKHLGYNNRDTAKLYLDFLPFIRIMPSDYPVLFWMKSLLKERLVVFDYGGNLGISFYSYRTLMPYPNTLRWVICDLPEITKLGKEIAKNNESVGLSFTNCFEDASSADVVIAAGALQYIEEPFWASVSRFKKKPPHVIFNKVPLYDGEPFVTLQNTGVSFCPYQIYNREKFINAMSQVGYDTIDLWKTPDFPCKIPFNPKRSFDAFSGLYLKLRSGN